MAPAAGRVEPTEGELEQRENGAGVSASGADSWTVGAHKDEI